MDRLILITWLPWAWKTTISNRLLEVNPDSNLIHLDELYLKFINEKYHYLSWVEISKNIQRHFERLIDSIKLEYRDYIIEEIKKQTKDTVIVEWRHLELLWYDIKKIFSGVVVIDEIVVNKEWLSLYQKWLLIDRNLIN